MPALAQCHTSMISPLLAGRCKQWAAPVQPKPPGPHQVPPAPRSSRVQLQQVIATTVSPDWDIDVLADRRRLAEDITDDLNAVQIDAVASTASTGSPPRTPCQ